MNVLWLSYLPYLVDIASTLSAIFMLSASYAGCDGMLILMFFIISVGASGFIDAGLYVNPMDISPNYCSAIVSIANGIGAIIGFLVPYIIGILTPNVGYLMIRIKG